MSVDSTGDPREFVESENETSSCSRSEEKVNLYEKNACRNFINPDSCHVC
jgi:hypothetical protein